MQYLKSPKSQGKGVHAIRGAAVATFVGRRLGPGVSAGAPHPQPFPRKLRGGREPVPCV
jgi:hypothetical protein